MLRQPIMIKAIFYKELIKTQRTFWVSLLLAILFALYAIMGIRRVTATHGVEHVWLIMLMKEQTFIDSLKYLPAVIGIALGIAQMSPETRLKRLKLTLHLPYPQNKLIAGMLSAGLAELFVIFLVQALIICVYYAGIISSELICNVMITALPWYLAGFNAYLLTSAICLEGTWRRRIMLGLMSVGVLTVYYMQPAPQAYNSMLLGLIVFTALLLLLSINSVYRFKEGRID